MRIPTKDIYEWDHVSWSKSLEAWEPHLKVEKPLLCLEIGARAGGISLLVASYGHEILCTDLSSPESLARPLHSQYGLGNKITYSAVDLMNLHFEEQFDLIIFKSVLGGVARNDDLEAAKSIAQALRRALKPKGKVLFAENCRASILHQFLRKKWRHWGSSWSYFTLPQFHSIFSDFDQVEIQTYGFWSTFAIGRISRKIFSFLDRATCPMIPAKNRYIAYGVAVKAEEVLEN